MSGAEVPPYPQAHELVEAYRKRLAEGIAEPPEEFLAKHEDLRGLLEPLLQATLPIPELSAPPSPADEGRPDRIGPYSILDVLGQGGMGTVYIAEQKEPVRRRVAVKVIKLGMDSEEVLARFAAERQALAMMEHDNIAKVLDAGQTDLGQPYFAMEYVSGLPITEYCDQQALSTQDRLRLFQQVCAGVQHAHQKGVIHRDLKPSNILVTEHQGRGVPKIIDFGVAKATDHRLTQATLFTARGYILGTPEYMSPEQVGVASADIDTRTDIYSLGVILYELLVGELPFSSAELPRADLMEIQRKIREDEPPRPSFRLTRLGGDRKDTARKRKTNAASLARELKGDLDWVVMRAMEKDRNRRYATPIGLAEDIERFLEHKPVLAGPPSAVYRMKKFLRRYRLQVAAAAAVFVTLVAGIVGTAIGLGRAAEEAGLKAAEAERAEEERDRAEDLTSFMLFDLRERLEPLGRLDLLEPVALQAKAYYESRSLEDLSDDSRKKMGTSWTNLGHVFRDQGSLEEAAASYSSTLEIDEALLAKDRSNPSRMRDVAVSHANLGEVQRLQGNPMDALGSHRAALEIAKQLVARDPANVLWRGDLARFHHSVGVTLAQQGNLEEALESYTSALEIEEGLVTEEPFDASVTLDLALTRHNIGIVLFTQGDLEGAHANYTRALEIRDALFARDSRNAPLKMDLAVSHDSLGTLYREKGDLDSALESYGDALEIKKALVAQDPTNAPWQSDLAMTYNNAGVVLETLGDIAAALENHQSALEINRGLVVQDPSNAMWKRSLATNYSNVGVLENARENFEDSLASHREALEIRRQLSDQDPSNAEWTGDLATSHFHIGTVLRRRGDPQGSLQSYRRSIELREALVVRNPSNAQWQRDLAQSYDNIAFTLQTRGDLEAALERYESALGIREALVARDPSNAQWKSDLAATSNNLGLALEDRGDPKSALERYERALGIYEELVGRDPSNAFWKSMLARIHFNVALAIGQADPEAALTSFRRTAQIREELVDLNPSDMSMRRSLAQVNMGIAYAAYDTGGYGEAIAAFSNALTEPEYRTDLERGHVYNAACSAALAAGVSGDEGAAGMRSQALQWLEEDLQMRSARVAELESAIGAGRASDVEEQMRAELQRHREHFEWARTGDADLASVRGLPEFVALFEKYVR